MSISSCRLQLESEIKPRGHSEDSEISTLSSDWIDFDDEEDVGSSLISD